MIRCLVSRVAGLVQRGESFQIALHVVVVPAAHGEYGNVNAVDIFSNAELFPERIVSGMIQDRLVEAQGAGGGGAIGSAQRKMHDVVAELRLAERLAGVRFSENHSSRCPSFMAPPGE